MNMLNRLNFQNQKFECRTLRHSLALDGLAAVIYVPYGIFYSWSFVMGGVTCGAPPTACWLPEFAKLPVFGIARSAPRGTCCRDLAQLPLLKLWEELGKHHDRIQVVGDANMLVKLPLAHVSKRVFLRYRCVMKEKWDFPGGLQQQKVFEDTVRKQFFFEEISVSQDFCN